MRIQYLLTPTLFSSKVLFPSRMQLRQLSTQSRNDLSARTVISRQQVCIVIINGLWHNAAVKLRLNTRKFRCRNEVCQRRIPCERLPDVVQAFDSGIKELKSFANGLQKDFLAVKEATVSEWSNGQTEGQVNRLKLLKRQMYGRANFDLLRARVIHQA